jgi:Na+/serine symporter
MPFLLSIIGIVLIVSAYQNTYKQLGSLIANDFTGSGNFLYWMIAVLVVGSIGYYSSGSQTVSRLFLVLILIGILVSNKSASVISSIIPQIQSGTTKQTSASSTSGSVNSDVTGFASGFLNGINQGIGSSILGNVLQ